MTWLNLIVLAVVQGITEFLPISSSAHLILVPYLGPLPRPEGLDMDIAVHVGTLGAVMSYFFSGATSGRWPSACGRSCGSRRPRVGG